VSLPPDVQLAPGSLGSPGVGISPDGRYVSFYAIQNGVYKLFVRGLNSVTATALPGTEGATSYPFWSPDSRFIAFRASGKLKKIAVSGGPPQTLCEYEETPTGGAGGTWNTSDVILFQSGVNIVKVSAAGGVPAILLSPDPSKQETAYRYPEFLPDGTHFLFLSLGAQREKTEIRVSSMGGGPAKPVLSAISYAAYAPSGHILFGRDNVLMAQPFDPVKLTLAGEPIRVADSVATGDAGTKSFSVSQNGVLVYRTNGYMGTQMAWFDRTGRQVGMEAGGGGYNTEMTLSPDETRVAYVRIDDSGTSVWIRDLKRETDTRLTFGPGVDQYPVWSPDGRKIVFGANRSGKLELYEKASNGLGPEDPLHVDSGVPTEWMPNGLIGFLAVTGRVSHVWALPTDGDRKPYPILNDRYDDRQARISPDGKFMAYTSLESGRNQEIYVQTFPPGGGKWQISVNGGFFPMWRHDGKEIFFLNRGDNKLMSAEVRLGKTFEADVPKGLFGLPPAITDRYVLTGDGQKFLFTLIKEQGPGVKIVTVLNWADGLKK
jgi:eukaryotic-like serine/threonine-protein kinase